MHWKYPFPTSYIYIHCSEFSHRSNWLKIGDFGDENHQSRAKGETKQKHTWKTHLLKPSFFLCFFWTIRKKSTSSPSPFMAKKTGEAHIKSISLFSFGLITCGSMMMPLGATKGLWPQSKSSVKVLPGLTTIWIIYQYISVNMKNDRYASYPSWWIAVWLQVKKVFAEARSTGPRFHANLPALWVSWVPQHFPRLALTNPWIFPTLRWCSTMPAVEPLYHPFRTELKKGAHQGWEGPSWQNEAEERA